MTECYKQPFETKDAALKHVNRTKFKKKKANGGKNDKRHKPYRCWCCKKFHLTSSED